MCRPSAAGVWNRCWCWRKYERTVMIVDGIVESIFGENMRALSGLINRGE